MRNNLVPTTDCVTEGCPWRKKFVSGDLSAKSEKISDLLHDEKSINTFNATSGRIQGLVCSISYGKWAEIEVLNVTVAAEKAEDIFWFIFDKVGLGELGGGLLFQAPLLPIPFELPEIQEES